MILDSESYNLPELLPDDPSIGDVLEWKQDGLFHIGQSYEKKVADTVFCKGCGGNKFNVGQGSYYTAIRCVVCEYEILIHEG